MHSPEQTLWDADETRGLVVATRGGTIGSRGDLRVVHPADVVVFVLSPGRAHEVPAGPLGPVEEGLLVVDRSAASQAMARVKDGTIVPAFCRAQVRRDIVTVARSGPDQESWAPGGMERIGAWDDGNDRRREAPRTTPQCAACDQEVRRCVAVRERERGDERARPELHPARRKVREGLRAHGTGPTVFVEHPEVPTDNHTAERSGRGPVVGRKNSDGSGAV